MNISIRQDYRILKIYMMGLSAALSHFFNHKPVTHLFGGFNPDGFSRDSDRRSRRPVISLQHGPTYCFVINLTFKLLLPGAWLKNQHANVQVGWVQDKRAALKLVHIKLHQDND